MKYLTALFYTYNLKVLKLGDPRLWVSQQILLITFFLVISVVNLYVIISRDAWFYHQYYAVSIIAAGIGMIFFVKRYDVVNKDINAIEKVGKTLSFSKFKITVLALLIFLISLLLCVGTSIVARNIAKFDAVHHSGQR